MHIRCFQFLEYAEVQTLGAASDRRWGMRCYLTTIRRKHRSYSDGMRSYAVALQMCKVRVLIRTWLPTIRASFMISWRWGTAQWQSQHRLVGSRDRMDSNVEGWLEHLTIRDKLLGLPVCKILTSTRSIGPARLLRSLVFPGEKAHKHKVPKQVAHNDNHDYIGSFAI